MGAGARPRNAARRRALRRALAAVRAALPRGGQPPRTGGVRGAGAAARFSPRGPRCPGPPSSWRAAGRGEPCAANRLAARKRSGAGRQSSVSAQATPELQQKFTPVTRCWLRTTSLIPPVNQGGTPPKQSYSGVSTATWQATLENESDLRNKTVPKLCLS